MVSCLMGDSTALASAIVRCCLKETSEKIFWRFIEKEAFDTFIAILVLDTEHNPLFFRKYTFNVKASQYKQTNCNGKKELSIC